MQKVDTSSKLSNTFSTNSLSQFFQSLNVTVSINCLIFCELSPFMSKNTVAITLRTDDVVLNFFAVGDYGCFHIIEFRFVYGVMWWTQVSSPVTILSRKVGSSW
jgi:hypothetical protein